MKKVAIFGGSFDPVHNGHISLAKDAVEQVGLDNLIFMPVNVQPFKQYKSIAGGNERLMMLRMAIEEDPAFALSNYELREDGISYTYKTLRVFQEALGCDTKLYFICGTDAFLKIEDWKESEELLKNYSYIIGARPGYKEEELKEIADRVHIQYNTEVVIINNRKVDTSSTEIRKAISEGKPIDNAVPEFIAEYIEENELYI